MENFNENSKATKSLENKSMFFDSFDDFLVFSSRFKSEHTKKVYLTNICAFCDFCANDVTSASKEDCQQYIEYLKRKMEAGELSPKSVYGKISTISSFVTYLQGIYPEKEMPNYMYELPRPEISVFITRDKVADYQAIDMLLTEAKKSSDRTLYVILLLVLRMGLTTSQICNLKKGQAGNIVIDKNGNPGILINGKYKNTYIKIPSDIFEVLSDYLNNREATDTSDYLFVNRDHQQFKERALERRVSRLMDKTFDKACSYTLQDLRNTAITLMLKRAKPEDHNMIADATGVAPKWLGRYKYAIDAFEKSAVDLIDIEIKKDV